MGHLSRMQQFIIGAARFRSFDGQIDNQGSSNDVGPWYKAPVTAVLAVVAVVTHYEILIPGNDHVAFADVTLQFVAPAPLQPARISHIGGEIVTITVRRPLSVDDVTLLQRNTVHINHLFAKAHVVSRQSDDALPQELGGVYGEIKDNDVPAADLGVREEPVLARQASKMQLVYQQKIADQQGVLHGAGRYLKGLYHESDHEYAENHNREE